jgi:hypothetical protein
MTNDLNKANVESAPKRRTWDALPAISTFLSSVVLGAVALWVNSTYSERQSIRAREAQEQQQKLNRVQTLVAFMPHLSSTSETREVALFGIAALGYPDLALKLTQLRKSDTPQSGPNVADAIMRNASASVPLQAPVDVSRPAKGTSDEIGWVYLGNYSGGQWSTQYLSFSSSTSPDSLVGQTHSVHAKTGALNVRVGMPTEQGEFLGITRTLPAGAKVRILEVHPWLTTGYIWARVGAA